MSKLPPEIQLTIIDQLDPVGKLNLRITSRYYYDTIKPLTPNELLQTEKSDWAIKNGLLRCMDCKRLRPSSCFADSMRKGKKGRNGLEPEKRFCIDCGVHPKFGRNRYTPGSEIEINTQRWVICKVCNLFMKLAFRGTGRCQDCFEENKDIPRFSFRSRRRYSDPWEYTDDDILEAYDKYMWEE
ncbi:hypothetical protein M501DRAFT_1017180 [Patellaria atrata CBS 101060]|uniref:F-box domain-containing protein n=1 Tax=Patellaria atrata CBS 101060 TaxID=1346257 RepID=A0A9P4S8R6_9PEZI|nr:hypothetical protein M501DRAFT_1017180 [Patellaria atrata CBS 101060]